MQFAAAANALGMHSECIRNALEEEKRQAKEAANVAAKIAEDAKVQLAIVNAQLRPKSKREQMQKAFEELFNCIYQGHRELNSISAAARAAKLEIRN
jgi:NAD(P)H-dependent flavin oxidoreductase YrpB (nitropropane dioxygenase family)